MHNHLRTGDDPQASMPLDESLRLPHRDSTPRPRTTKKISPIYQQGHPTWAHDDPSMSANESSACAFLGLPSSLAYNQTLALQTGPSLPKGLRRSSRGSSRGERTEKLRTKFMASEKRVTPSNGRNQSTLLCPQRARTHIHVNQSV